jgi:hypothetical protein
VDGRRTFTASHGAAAAAYHTAAGAVVVVVAAGKRRQQPLRPLPRSTTGSDVQI